MSTRSVGWGRHLCPAGWRLARRRLDRLLRLRNSMTSSTLRSLAAGALLALVYVGIARFGLMMDAVAGFATLVWPPTGIALAALLLFGLRLWPAVTLGAFLVNFWIGASVPVASGIAVGNTLEALAAAYALRRIPPSSGPRPLAGRAQPGGGRRSSEYPPQRHHRRGGEPASLG